MCDCVWLYHPFLVPGGSSFGGIVLTRSTTRWWCKCFPVVRSQIFILFSFFLIYISCLWLVLVYLVLVTQENGHGTVVISRSKKSKSLLLAFRKQEKTWKLSDVKRSEIIVFYTKGGIPAKTTILHQTGQSRRFEDTHSIKKKCIRSFGKYSLTFFKCAWQQSKIAFTSCITSFILQYWGYLFKDIICQHI